MCRAIHRNKAPEGDRKYDGSSHPHFYIECGAKTICQNPTNLHRFTL